MEVYLIRHGQVDYAKATDVYALGLTPQGLAQAERVARLCREWRIEFLCVSTMIRAQQTADAISAAIPDALRWDLEELEELNVTDLGPGTSVGPLMSNWTQAQIELALEHTWIRVMAALARIQVYTEAHGFERIAIVAHGYVIKLLLLNWLGLDWRAAASRVDILTDYAATHKVILDGEGRAQIDWINRL